MALAPLGAMAPPEMNEGTNYSQGGTKGLSVRPRCFGAAWPLPSGHHHHHDTGNCRPASRTRSELAVYSINSVLTQNPACKV
jgi:hypothetical protein